MTSPSEEISFGVRLATDEQLVYNTLSYVFDYFDLDDLYNCARVSPLWRWVVSCYVGWKHLTVYCCEKHLEGITTLFPECLRNVVVYCEAKLPRESFKSFCETSSKLLNVTLLNCRLEHLRVLAEHQVNIEKIYGFLIEYTTTIYLDMLGVFQNLSQLELDINAQIENAFGLSGLEQLKHLTLTSRFGEPTWLEVLQLEQIESLCIYGDFEKDSWKTILFEQGHILKFKQLKTLKLAWYYTTFYLENHIFLNRIKDIANLTQLILIGIFIDARYPGEFSDYLSQCKNLEKLHIKFGMIFSPRLSNPLINNMYENCELLKAVLSLGNNFRRLHWTMPPTETSIQLTNDMFNDVLITYNIESVNHEKISIVGGFIVSIPPREFKNMLRKIKPNCEIFIEDVEDCREPDTGCLVCGLGIYKRNFLDE